MLSGAVVLRNMDCVGLKESGNAKNRTRSPRARGRIVGARMASFKDPVCSWLGRKRLRLG